MNQRGIFLTAILITLISISNALAGEVLVPASVSCRTDLLQPDTNRSDANKLSIRSDASAAKSWIKFDLSALTDRSSIRGAILRLALNEDEGNYQFDVSAVNDNYTTNIGWAEGGITWNNAPANDTDNQSDPDFSKSVLIGTVDLTGNYLAGSQHYIDVTSAIKGDTDGVVQFILHNSNSLINCATHDHTGGEAYWPTLIVTYPPPGADFPDPAIGETVETDIGTLSWQAGSGAVRSEIYLGKDEGVVANAQRLSGDVDGDGLVDLSDLGELALQWLMGPSAPCPDLDYSGIVDMPDLAKVGADWQEAADAVYLGATTGTTIEVGDLDPSATYYWRVDSVTCDHIVPGEVWEFQTKVPAFPGAEGFGKWASGGRGGSVYHVTNLNDSGTGSFRDAISGSNRTVVFDVSGIINLGSRITTMSKDITIAGQTAPGEGIMIYGDGLSYTNANRTITRYMRYRMGRYGTDGADAVGIANGNTMIFDHCSFTWGRDENFSVNNGDNENPGFITLQDCIIGQGLVSHSCGGLMVDWDDGLSILRCLYIDNDTRNPKVRGINEFVNSVVYNWDDGAYLMAWTESLTDYSYANAINNYFISGPNMGSTTPFRKGNSAFHIYHSNNWWDYDKDGVFDGRVLTDADYTWNNETVVNEPFDYPGVKTLLEPRAAVKSIASVCGPSFPVRDRTDRRLIEEMMSFGKLGEHISDENASPMYGVGTIESGINPTDTDQDGMPDYWEKSIAGLNENAADNNGDVNGNGYTNLEDYINWLGGLHANVPMNAYADINLRTFTSGFDAGATYTVFDVTGGEAVLKSDGHTVRYTPDTDYLGRAQFSFSVDDGDSMSTTVHLLVSEYGGHPLDPVYPTNLSSGVTFRYYTGTWQYLPDFGSMTPVTTGFTYNYDLPQELAEDGYACEYEGFINVPSDGLYTFYTRSDDGSRLYIDDGVVVSNDGIHGSQEMEGNAALIAGMHKIRVTFFEYSGGQELAVSWAGPGFEKQLIPNSVLYRGSLDLVPPSVPTGLKATASSGIISLDWDDNSESDLAGYDVYRTMVSGSAYIKLNDNPVADSDFDDDTASYNVLYHYIVLAVDNAMNPSDYPGEISALMKSGGTTTLIQDNTYGFCGVDGTVDSNNAGFTGNGFANTDNSAGLGVDWSVNIATAGTYTFTWRYANGSSDRPGNLLVDGAIASSGINFPGTGAWTTWDEVSTTATLATGTHHLRLQATGSGGLGNIDYIMLFGAAPAAADCP